MSENYHTPIATGAAANASTFNVPLGALDSGLTTAATIASATAAEVTAARDVYANLDARLDGITFGYVGGNIATLTDGAANAAQKNVTVDSTAGFVVGAYVAYMLVGGALEYNTIGSITPTTGLVLGTDIGTGGIANNSYIGMISVSEYQAAQAINHGAADLTLAQAIQYAAGGEFNVKAYGAKGDGVADDTAAIQATWDAMTDYDRMVIPAGVYLISDTLSFRDLMFTSISSRGAYIRTKAGSDFSGKAMIDCAGSTRMSVDGLTMQENLASNNPAAGFVLGRTTIAAGFYKFYGVLVEGSFTVATLYNIGGEASTFIGSWFSNAYPGATVVISGNSDDDGLVGMDAGQLTGWFLHCALLNFSPEDEGGHTIKLRGRTADHAFRDCYFYTANNGITLEMLGAEANDVCYNTVLDGCRVEVANGSRTDYRFVKVNVTNGASFLTIRNCDNSADGGYWLEVAASNNLTSTIMESLIDGGMKVALFGNNSVITKTVIRHQGAAMITVGSTVTLADNLWQWFSADWPLNGTDGKEFVRLTRTMFTAFAANDATPSVATGDQKHFYTANSSATTITNFDNGFDGQEIWVLISDVNTTLGFYPATGASALLGNNGANRAMSLTDAVHAVYYSGYWHCLIVDGYTA